MDNNGGDMMPMMNNGSGDGFCQGPGRVMFPGFQFTFDPSDNPMVATNNCVIWLFSEAVLDTQAKYIGALFGTFFLCVFLELLRAQRVHLVNQTGRFEFLKTKPTLVADLLNAFSYMVQVGIAYWIMLLVMLYEGLFFIAILLGLGSGYFMTLRMKRAEKTKNSDGGDLSSKVISTCTPGTTTGTGDEEGGTCCGAGKTADQTCTCTSPCCENN
jgi:hypothetical protein